MQIEEKPVVVGNQYYSHYVFDGEDIRKHLEISQNIISDLIKCSSNCKTWVVTLLAAMTALQMTRTDIGHFGWVSITVIFLFWFLDARYRYLEYKHRDRQLEFVELCRKGDSKVWSIIYIFDTGHIKGKPFKAAFCTKIFPFYFVLLVLNICLSWGREICISIESLSFYC